jgi:adenylosuccinate synthase
MRTDNIAILDAAFGDNGKGRATLYWSQHKYHQRHYVVRFGGGANCGHTLYHNGVKIVRHLLPSTDFSNPDAHAFLASGVAIDPDAFLQEVQETEELFPGAAARTIVDPDAFVVLPKHKEQDKENVVRIGSTGKGITPCLSDRINRCGTKLSALIKDKTEVIQSLQKLGVQFKYVSEMYETFQQSDLIFEGGQGILLEIPFGPYPYVSSGECSLNGIYNSGFARFLPSNTYACIKPYFTAVGNMPLPTEQKNEWGDEIRKRGNEKGATTNRPRRIGGIDLPALRYALSKSTIDRLILTKLDILTGMDTIPVCLSYEQGDPISGQDFFSAKPIISQEKGWKEIGDEAYKDFICLIETATGKDISYVSWGTGKDEMGARKMGREYS